MTCSLLVSALLALAWQRGQTTSPQGEAKVRCANNREVVMERSEGWETSDELGEFEVIKPYKIPSFMWIL